MHTSQFFLEKLPNIPYTYPYVVICGGDPPTSQCYDNNFNISSFAWCSMFQGVTIILVEVAVSWQDAGHHNLAFRMLGAEAAE